MRTVTIDGNPWYIGKGVADILGLLNINNAYGYNAGSVSNGECQTNGGRPMWGFFRRASSIERFAKGVVSKHVEDGRTRARTMLEGVRVLYFAEALGEPGLAVDLSDAGDAGVLAADTALLWGFFYEHVQTIDAPTNGFLRISALIIDFFSETKGFSFETGRSIAWSAQARYDADDPVFMRLAEIGMAAYGGRDFTAEELAAAYRQQLIATSK
tara:strand:+ start:499 stop:1137 length:639 start_codon:yes stop_codon:yes gene_type:complete